MCTLSDSSTHLINNQTLIILDEEYESNLSNNMFQISTLYFQFCKRGYQWFWN